ncbi:hypothetical protein PSYJA_08258 [Pseudomonas syringae pv. japonica str. M301072]|uniref:Uncharacterized protein n=1 Tax=Pseudomonas syringae pv. japonica str. M301072 TaxID=629262 RepID=F3FFH3_PSESX|nr:hypothetical protein PSYJA_08258 [Pseudomonas syringae pv. japonica str. M301072]
MDQTSLHSEKSTNESSSSTTQQQPANIETPWRAKTRSHRLALLFSSEYWLLFSALFTGVTALVLSAIRYLWDLLSPLRRFLKLLFLKVLLKLLTWLLIFYLISKLCHFLA